jgi:3-deoxy-7-phosphoheptulonate synthase
MKDAKLALKTHAQHNSVVDLGRGIRCGAKELLIIAGPCTVENSLQMEIVGDKLQSGPINAIRGGVFKPRTSPYTFQGLGEEGLAMLAAVGERLNLPIVSEVMSCEQLELMQERVDVLQVGSRNMQNFELLKELGRQSKPVLLKRGLSATIEEFVMAAEYLLCHGNQNVILCERGIRSFDSFTRNVFDLGAVVALKQLTHLPVIADPSHACGKRELVASLARAAVAAGADGLMIECHPEPEKSVSDARQAVSLEEMLTLAESIRPIAEAVGRSLAPVRVTRKFEKVSA